MKRGVLVAAMAVGLALACCSILVDTKGLTGDGADAGDASAQAEGGVQGGGNDASTIADGTTNADASSSDGGSSNDGGCDWASPFDLPVLIAELSSGSDDQTVRLTLDELTGYLTTKRGNGLGQLYVASRSSPSAAFAMPTIVNGIDGGQNEFQASITADQLTLFFDSDRPDGGVRHIYSASRASTASDFSNVVERDGELGTPTDQHYRAFVMPDALALYYTGPADDISRASRVAAMDPFSAGVPVTELNSASQETLPTLTPDELVVYFGSDRPGGAGGLDIWTARRSAKNQPFGAPIRVMEASSNNDDIPSWISADLCRLYMYSNRPGGMGGYDVYLATRKK
jgi:hypothetical protein